MAWTWNGFPTRVLASWKGDRILLTGSVASYTVTVQRGARFTGMWLVQDQQALGVSYEGHGASPIDEYEIVGVGKQDAVSVYAWNMNGGCHLHREA